MNDQEPILVPGDTVRRLAHTDRLAFLVDAARYAAAFVAAVRRARRSPSDHRYPPFHDVQAVLEGEAAACLGAMIRQRWRQVTGERLAAPEEEGSVWPVGVTAAAEDLDLGLVRTRPEHGASPEVRETERLHLAAIAASSRSRTSSSPRVGLATRWRVGSRATGPPRC